MEKLIKYCTNCGKQTNEPTFSCPDCGSILALKSGQLFMNQYRITMLLNSTDMSQVYLTKDTNMYDRTVVLKIAINLSGPVSTNKTAKRALNMEKLITAHLSHPNLVTVYDAGVTDDGTPYLIMEYVDGSSLYQVLRHKKRLDFVTATRFMLQLCDALITLHKAGFIHKDLKPGNIMVTQFQEHGTEHIKLLDFGISQRLHPTLSDISAENEIIGTVQYMSPEHKNKVFVGIPSDIFSAGVILYEMLSGTLPFGDNNSMESPRIPVSLRTLGLNNIPASMDDLILQMLSMDTEMRPADCSEVKQRLEQMLNPYRRVTSSSEVHHIVTGNRLSLNTTDDFIFYDRESDVIVDSLPMKTGSKGRIWSILGPKGMGKTHLLDIVVKRVRRKADYFAHVFPFAGGDYPLEVLRQFMSEILSESADQQEDLKQELKAFLKKNNVNLPENLTERVFNLLYHPHKLTDTSQLQGMLLENYVFATITDFIQAYALHKPVLMCFDDCQLYGSLFQRFLEFLSAKIGNSALPISIITAWNTPDELMLKDTKIYENTREQVSYLELGALPDQKIEDFIGALLPRPPCNVLKQELVKLSEGSPYNVLEYIRYLNSISGFSIDRDKVCVSDTGLFTEVPPSISQLYEKRLETVLNNNSNKDALEILGRLVLLGTDANKTLLELVLDNEGRLDLKHRLDIMLDTLSDLGLIKRSAEDHRDRLIVPSRLLNITTEQYVTQRLGIDTIAAIANTLEAYRQGRLSDRYERLARLYELAGYTSKAVQYYLMLARLDRTNFDLQKALKALNKAKSLLRQAGFVDTRQWHIVERELFTVFKDLGRIKDALELYQDKVNPARVATAEPMELNELMEVASLMVLLRRNKQVMPLLAALLKRFKASRANLLISKVYLMYAHLHIWAGDSKRAGQALDSAKKHLEGREISLVHWQMAIMRGELLLLEEKLDEAVQVFDKVLAALKDPAYYQIRVDVQFLKGIAMIRMGNMEQARHLAEQAIELSNRFAYRRGVAEHTMNIVLVDFFQGKCVQGAPDCALVIGMNKEIGDPFFDASIKLVQAYVHICQNRLQAAENVANEALRISSSTTYNLGKGSALLKLATIRAHQDKWDQAEDLLNQAIGVLKRVGNAAGIGFNQPEIHALQGQILLHKGKTDEGYKVLIQAYHEFTRLNRTMEAGKMRECFKEKGIDPDKV